MIWTKRKVRDEIAKAKIRHQSEAASAIVTCVHDVAWGFMSPEEAVDVHLDGTFWPHVVLDASRREEVRRMLIMVREAK